MFFEIISDAHAAASDTRVSGSVACLGLLDHQDGTMGTFLGYNDQKLEHVIIDSWVCLKMLCTPL